MPSSDTGKKRTRENKNLSEKMDDRIQEINIKIRKKNNKRINKCNKNNHWEKINNHHLKNQWGDPDKKTMRWIPTENRKKRRPKRIRRSMCPKRLFRKITLGVNINYNVIKSNKSNHLNLDNVNAQQIIRTKKSFFNIPKYKFNKRNIKLAF